MLAAAYLQCLDNSFCTHHSSTRTQSQFCLCPMCIKNECCDIEFFYVSSTRRQCDYGIAFKNCFWKASETNHK